MLCLVCPQAALRESYLEDTEVLIRRQEVRGLGSLEDAQAAARRVEGLGTDALVREQRFTALTEMARTVETGNYHSKEEVIRRWGGQDKTHWPEHCAGWLCSRYATT